MTLVILALLAQSHANGSVKERVADDSATAFACSIETLQKGQNCTFEADLDGVKPAAKQGDINQKAATQLATPLCARASKSSRKPKPDNVLFTLCMKEFAVAAEVCGAEETPLFDAKGRFSPEARECYEAMGEAMSRATTLTETGSRCCACAAANKCSAADQCFSTLGGAGQNTTCLTNKCVADCENFLPRANTATPPPSAAVPPATNNPVQRHEIIVVQPPMVH